MALLFIDSFDHYTTAQLEDKWTAKHGGGTVGISSSLKRNGIQALQVRNQTVMKTLATSNDTMIVGFALYMENDFNTVYPTNLCGLGAENHIAVALCGTKGGRLGVYACSPVYYFNQIGYALLGGTFSDPDNGVINVGQWYYIELKIKVGQTDGAATVRVNEQVVLDITNVDTSMEAQAEGVKWDHFIIGGFWGAVDDLYICDASGTTCNDFLGDVRIDAHFPTGEGATTAWTASAGSNYECVDETTSNGVTDYVFTTSASVTDTYEFEDLKNVDAQIVGIQVLASAAKTDAGTGTIANVVRIGATDYAFDTSGVGMTYSYWARTPLAISPATGTNWTQSEFNSIEAGIAKLE